MNLSEDMEVLSADDVKIYDNDIEIAIEDACTKMEIKDLRKEGQRTWKAVMRYVGKKVFNDRSILKSRILNIYKNNNIPTNNNSYDYELINKLCDYYIYLSDVYVKLISTVAFSYFLNIPTTTIDLWKDTEPSTTSFKIWKKLQENREDSLKDKAVDSGNVMGTFQVGRREYQWDMPGVREERKQIQGRTPEQIAAEYGRELCENKTQLELPEMPE